MSDSTAQGMPRRSIVAVAGALLGGAALAGCTTRRAPELLTPTASAPGNAELSAAAPAPASTTPTPPPGIPTKQEILARFGSVKPTQWALNLPGEVTRISSDAHGVALTFDACGGRGGSGYDERLITVLRTHQVKATLNFNARWIRENESLAKELAADPLFNIANHGDRHLPLSTSGRSAYGIPGTKNLSEMYDEIVGARAWIAEHCPGQPVHFRSGTCFTDEVGVAVCKALGSPFVGYTLNADGGATFTKDQVAEALLGVKAGDVVISHMNHPERDTAKGYEAILPKLIDGGVTFHHLPA